MKTIQMVGLALMCALMVNITPVAGAERLDANATMALVDKNKDGRIDREEFHQRMTEVFFFADVDKDGQLTFAELVTVEKVDSEAFKRADRDGSGKLSSTAISMRRIKTRTGSSTCRNCGFWWANRNYFKTRSCDGSPAAREMAKSLPNG
jgi:hypothetical protein